MQNPNQMQFPSERVKIKITKKIHKITIINNPEES